MVRVTDPLRDALVGVLASQLRHELRHEYRPRPQPAAPGLDFVRYARAKARRQNRLARNLRQRARSLSQA